mmetsp:Transcript_2078/g.5279  ORF Transcript_2078/g.5279 Transcript_2078/m.5279 type:complete len:233 (-) Transcript_2078:3101-3799(-)
MALLCTLRRARMGPGSMSRPRSQTVPWKLLSLGASPASDAAALLPCDLSSPASLSMYLGLCAGVVSPLASLRSLCISCAFCCIIITGSEDSFGAVPCSMPFTILVARPTLETALFLIVSRAPFSSPPLLVSEAMMTFARGLRPTPTGRCLLRMLVKDPPSALRRSLRASACFLRSLMISGVSTTCLNMRPSDTWPVAPLCISSRIMYCLTMARWLWLPIGLMHLCHHLAGAR